MKKLADKFEGELIILFSDLVKILYTRKKNFDEVLFDVVNLIEMLLKKNNTIILPTYNLRFPKTKITGYSGKFITAGSIFKSLVNKFKFKRTTKPMYNYAVLGKKENLILNLKQTSAWCPNSVIGYLSRNKAFAIGIDTNFKTFTWVVIHSCEEELKVPYRFYKTFRGYHEDLKQNVSEKMYVRNLSKPKINLYQKKVLKKLFFNKKLIVKKINSINYSVINLNEYYLENLRFLTKLNIKNITQ